MKEEHIVKMHEQAAQSFNYALEEGGDYRKPWRIFKIMSEFVEGYQFLTSLKKEVTIFGSARLSEDHPSYKEAQKLGELLGKNGFTTITGGGPGIMEAANRGAHAAGGESVGLNIELPFEQIVNPYVKKSASFNYFFTRKVMLTSPANAFVFLPGGFGTMDEFFEVIDLMELGYIAKAPIVLVGKAYWQPLLRVLVENCIASISQDIVDTWFLVDTAEEAFEHIKDIEDVVKACDLSPNNFHCQGNIDWKIFQVMSELVEGFDFLTGTTKGATVLGTKSIESGPYYEAAVAVGAALAEAGYEVITGGKNGIAAAANKGAFEAGGTSVGVGMKIGKKTDMNPYLTKSILFDFPFTRKLIVTSPTKAFVVFPGGFGTMHQLFEVLTLMQTKKMPKLPILLYDSEFWEPLHEYITSIFVDTFKTISKGDESLYTIVNSLDEINTALAEHDTASV